MPGFPIRLEIRMRKLLATVCLVAILMGSLVALAGCSGAYVGSTMSNKYHDPSCVWADEIDGDRRVTFGSAEEAEAAGYKPCGTCLGGETPVEE